MNVHSRLVLQAGNIESISGVITSIIASVEMVSGAHRKDIQVSKYSSTNGALIVDICFKGPSAMENVCCLGEHVRSFDSPLHNLPDLKDLYSGASMHILSPTTVTGSNENSRRGPVKSDGRTGLRRSCRTLEPRSLGQVTLPTLHLPAVDQNDRRSDILGTTDTDPVANLSRASACVNEVFTRTWCDVAVQCGKTAQPFTDHITASQNGTITLNRTGYVILRPTGPKMEQYNARKLTASFTPFIVIVCDSSHMKMESGTVSTKPAVNSATLTTLRLPNVNIGRPMRCFRIQTMHGVQINEAQYVSRPFDPAVSAVSPLTIVANEITCYEGLEGSTTPTDESIRRADEGCYDRQWPMRDPGVPTMQPVPSDAVEVAENSQTLTELDQSPVITTERSLRGTPVDILSPEASFGVSEDPVLFVVRKKATDLWGN